MRKIVVEVCVGTHCTMLGATHLIDAIHSLREIREEMGTRCEVEVRAVPCIKSCKQQGNHGPVVVVDGELIERAQSEAVMARILQRCLA